VNVEFSYNPADVQDYSTMTWTYFSVIELCLV